MKNIYISYASFSTRFYGVIFTWRVREHGISHHWYHLYVSSNAAEFYIDTNLRVYRFEED